jgi:hypothetical protein
MLKLGQISWAVQSINSLIEETLGSGYETKIVKTTDIFSIVEKFVLDGHQVIINQ